MTQTVGFGGGCHWCTEAVIEAIAGVTQVEQGWITSLPPDDAESEAVRVQFDPAVIDLRALMRVHLQTHASTSNHALRSRYRSAVYTTSPAQQQQVADLLADLQAEFPAPLVTRALPLAGFRSSPPRYRHYYARRPEAPFCQRHIAPKIKQVEATVPTRAAGIAAPEQCARTDSSNPPTG